MRTHYCGLINESLVGQTVTLCGWVNTLRLQSHVAFVDLRDHEGLAQVVIERDNAAAFATAGEIGNEYCVRVTGTLRKRLRSTTS
jgi:aspartyl-tRNA synthetase